MKITILGSGTAALRKNKHESGYLLEVDGKYYLFDSGAGTVYRLLDKNIDLNQVDNIFYTHLHNDHINDLPAILWSNNYKDNPRKKKLFLYGPDGFKRYYEILRNEILGKDFEFKYDVEVSEITNKKIEVDNLKIETRELKHYGNIAYRIEHNGKIIVYSGDTGYCTEIEEISKNADILILDCAEKDAEDHLNPSECGKIAKKANVKKLILVHSYPGLDDVDIVSECKKEFDGEVLAGKDLMEIELEA